MTPEMTLKSGYVTLARGAGRLSDVTGLSAWLDRRRDKARWAHWLRSLTAIHDLDGLVALDVPWWTYDAIDEVQAFLASRPAPKVFEYGSGASTVWLARRAAEVTSVEHHRGWHGQMTEVIGKVQGIAPVSLRLVEPDQNPVDDGFYRSRKAGQKGQTFRDYARAIEADPDALYDLIVIDGRARTACLSHAIDRLAPGGMIVFDNTHRARYRRAIEASGLSARVLGGLTPSLPYKDETTLITRPV